MDKFHEMCPAPGCTKRGDFARGYCQRDYLIMRAACLANGSWGRGVKLPSPIIIEHFEWEGSEDELAEMVEKQERKVTALPEAQERENQP